MKISIYLFTKLDFNIRFSFKVLFEYFNIQTFNIASRNNFISDMM